MKSNHSKQQPAKAKPGYLAARAAEAEKQADTARKLARLARTKFKEARKAYKQARKFAKLARKEAKAAGKALKQQAKSRRKKVAKKKSTAKSAKPTRPQIALAEAAHTIRRSKAVVPAPPQLSQIAPTGAPNGPSIAQA